MVVVVVVVWCYWSDVYSGDDDDNDNKFEVTRACRVWMAVAYVYVLFASSLFLLVG